MNRRSFFSVLTLVAIATAIVTTSHWRFIPPSLYCISLTAPSRDFKIEGVSGAGPFKYDFERRALLYSESGEGPVKAIGATMKANASYFLCYQQ